MGTTLYLELKSEPGTLNPFSYTDLYASYVQGYVIEGLLTRNIDTYKWEPLIAESWQVNPNGKEITFKIRKDVKFHDGTPLTVEDVKFSFDAIRNPEYKAARFVPYYENIKEAIIVDPQTIKFLIKKKYFNNLSVLAGLSIVSKNFYGDPKAKRNKVLQGSGPYVLHKYNRGRNIILKRNDDWVGFKLNHLKNTNNFEYIHYRFVKEANVALEMLKKGQLDYLETLTPEQFVKKTEGKPWGETAFKKKVQHRASKPYRYVGFNLKNPLFKDLKVRKAFAHLMNRELMIKKFRYDMDLPATGPWYQQSPYADPNVKPIPFDPKKAGVLMAQAGWSDSDKDGVLDKVIKGKKIDFKFTLVNSNADYEKYFTLYKEDLKKAGIIMNLQLVDFTSLIKLLDDKKFQAVSIGWGGGGVDNDPKQIWHSESIREGGSNYISYSSKLVDKLIDQGRAELDRSKRIKMYKKIYKAIADDVPYIFMFNRKFELYAHSNKVEFDKPTHEFAIGVSFWRPVQ